MVIASPEMALLSESIGLLPSGELSARLPPSAAAPAPVAQSTSKKQLFPAISLPLQLPASLASTARSEAVLTASGSGAPILAKNPNSALERTGRSDLTTVSRGELMSSERLREMEAVAGSAVNGGVGVGLESGGESELPQMSADEEVNGVLSGGGEHPYYDSLVRNKLPKRPEEASPKPVSARRLKAAGGLAADSGSDLLPSRPQRPMKGKQPVVSGDQIAAPVELADKRQRSAADGHSAASRGSGGELYPATLEGSHSEVSSSRKSFDSVVPAAGRHAISPSPPTRSHPQPDRPASRTSSKSAGHRAHRSHETESNSSERANHRKRSSERRAAQHSGDRDGDLTPIPAEEQFAAPLTPPPAETAASAAAGSGSGSGASSSRNNRAEARRKRAAGLTQRALEEHAEAEAQLASQTLLDSAAAPPAQQQKHLPVRALLQQRSSNSEAIDAAALLADIDANGDVDAELAAAVEALMQAQRESGEQETLRDGDAVEEPAMNDGHQTGPRAQRERPGNPVLHQSGPAAAVAPQTRPGRPSARQQQQLQRSSQAEQTVETEADEGSDVPAGSELEEVREEDVSDQQLRQERPPNGTLERRGESGVSKTRSGSSGRPTGSGEPERSTETRGGRGGGSGDRSRAAHQQNERNSITRSNGLATTSGVSSAPDQSLRMNGGVPPPLSERSSLHSERSTLAIQAFDTRLSRLEGALTRLATGNGAPGAAAAPASDPSRRTPFESPRDAFYSDMQRELAELKTVFSSTLANQSKQVQYSYTVQCLIS